MKEEACKSHSNSGRYEQQQVFLKLKEVQEDTREEPQKFCLFHRVKKKNRKQQESNGSFVF